ncbi:uncharacterized protein [Parasteatoda tepidariorum]|uniref:uncharacterized protein n=1 Tax=Parasteatoda tepidariorum TaxID=114398 RepID=UPI001C7201CE|nr:uncharacterized protein LOC107439166 [Parasteatoda tepidariorum]XP_015907139.2 uncharacterized protein LOC107439166 [Parasteatoda tepidariorum]XP_015907140.2 uncharacterized protein LOC107439166 [Parasteatoda tepidariorum]
MCAAQECLCLASNQSISKSSQLFNMSLIHSLNCASDKLPCESSNSRLKLFKSIQDCGTAKSRASAIEINNSYEKVQNPQSNKSLYISKACKYSFIASDYTSPEGQKLLSIKVYQNPSEVDAFKSKNFLSKRSISEYFLSKNGIEKDIHEDKSKENGLFKSWQRSIFKSPVSTSHEEDPNNSEAVKYQDSALNIANDAPTKSNISLHYQKQGLRTLEAEPSGSGVAENLDGKLLSGLLDEKFSHKGYNINPNVNFKVFDIESLSEAGEPCDSVSIENNAHFGIDDAWFIPSARHMFNAADISGSASAAQLSIASSFGDSSLPTCKICHTAAKPEDPLISPCRCTGTLRYIHCGCLMKWLEICNKRSRKPPTCELCKYQFHWHKKFKVGQWQFPHCSWQDKILHTVFLLSVLIMIGCAIVTVLCFKQHRGAKAEITHLELTQSEIITLICGALFFLSFFLAMYVEIKARNTIYKLLLKFIYLNQQWYIDEYDKRKESSAIDV